MADKQQNLPESGSSEAERALEERRKILRLGVYAAATTPMLLAMTTSAKAQDLSPICGIGPIC